MFLFFLKNSVNLLGNSFQNKIFKPARVVLKPGHEGSACPSEYDAVGLEDGGLAVNCGLSVWVWVTEWVWVKVVEPLPL